MVSSQALTKLGSAARFVWSLRSLLVPSWHTVLPQPYPTPRFLAHPGRLPSALVPRHYHGTATALLPWGAVPMGAVPWQ